MMRERDGEESPVKNGRGGIIASVLSSIGGISGLIMLIMVIWKGPALVAKVDGHEVRITAIEMLGSAAVQKHEAVDDERVNAMKARIAHLESAFETMGRMEVKIDNLKEVVDRIQRQHEPISSSKQ